MHKDSRRVGEGGLGWGVVGHPVGKGKKRPWCVAGNWRIQNRRKGPHWRSTKSTGRGTQRRCAEIGSENKRSLAIKKIEEAGCVPVRSE